jgi:pilus assembly protein Flp/PilA
MFRRIGAAVLAAGHAAGAAVKKFVAGKEEGASLVEYALLVALIAVVCIAGVTAIGLAINGGFNSLSGTINGVSW